MDDLQKKVLDAFKAAGEPMRPGDLAKASGIEKDDVAKAIKGLKKDGLIMSPKRCFYAPADVE